MKIMTQKPGFIKRAFTHNLREKLLSVLCAVVVMFVAVCFKPVNKVYSVKINTKISPDQVLVSENIDRIEVKVSGNFFELRKIKSEDLVINFDFSSEKAGEISRNIGDNELPASFLPLDVESVSPQILVFITEEKKAEPAETLPEAYPEQKPAESESEPAETVVPKTDENAVKTENGEKND
jgi:hypothetical protein